MNTVSSVLNDRKIEFGGEVIEIIPTLEKSFKLTKYRNQVDLGQQITAENKDTIKKIVNLMQKAKNDEITDEEFYSQLTPEEIKEFYKISSAGNKEYSLDECIEIISVALSIEKEEAKKIMNKEFEINGFDELQGKVNSILRMVFMSAKDTSQQNTEVVKVASK